MTVRRWVLKHRLAGTYLKDYPEHIEDITRAKLFDHDMDTRGVGSYDSVPVRVTIEEEYAPRPERQEAKP